jgi:hypothetical protein
VAISSSLMQVVPKYQMGRVQNTFAFGTRALQVVLGMTVGVVAHRFSLTAAFGLIALAYFVAFLTAAKSRPSRAAEPTAPPLSESAFEQASGSP